MGASDTIAKAVAEQVAFALKEFKKEHITPSTQNSGGAEWKQWKQCKLLRFTCGVNLSHNTARHWKKDGHDQYTTAMKTDPHGGGISSREKL